MYFITRWEFVAHRGNGYGSTLVIFGGQVGSFFRFYTRFSGKFIYTFGGLTHFYAVQGVTTGRGVVIGSTR